ncbi:MAG: AAA family ATPase [Oscillibacter sp.]|nr:AAA family ATPase [Oscillibacter sp.]
MAIYIQNLHIHTFRGIRDLTAEHLNHINLIVGDNNCGKTSVLEALLMLRDPTDFSNILRVARLRDQDNSLFTGKASTYENFYNLFPQPSEEPLIHLSARVWSRGWEEEAECTVSGEWTRILLDSSDALRSVRAPSSYKRILYLPSEAEAFVGVLTAVTGGTQTRESISFHEYSDITGRKVSRHEYLNMLYLSPVDHMKNTIINRIVKEPYYKDICLHVIQIFDPEITDLLILKNERTNRPVEYINHNRLGIMPVSTYGDGIKRVLMLANAIARSAGGVLLIDEAETAIHAQYYNDIFRFLVKACKKFEIQLFITTHNIEAFDSLLSTQDYEDQQEQDDITVLTLKKTREQTLIRNMSGREVRQNRDAFDFEVRI